jgi:hypothetical protein
MTHDELLLRIDRRLQKATWAEAHNEYSAFMLTESLTVLREVASLHTTGKIVTKTLPKTEYKIGYLVCEACSFISDNPIAYPCPTIQAIEKGLK